MPVTVVAYENASDFTSKSAPFWGGFLSSPLDNLPGNHGKISLKVDSVEDLVNKFTAKLGAESWTCDNLIISGHGAPGDQSVGDGENTSPGGKKSLTLDGVQDTLVGSSEKTLARIAPFLTADAVVLLGGCTVAMGFGSRKLLVILSKALGYRAVEASDSLQFTWVPGTEGNVWRAVGDRVFMHHRAWYNPSGNE